MFRESSFQNNTEVKKEELPTSEEGTKTLESRKIDKKFDINIDELDKELISEYKMDIYLAYEVDAALDDFIKLQVFKSSAYINSSEKDKSAFLRKGIFDLQSILVDREIKKNTFIAHELLVSDVPNAVYNNPEDYYFDATSFDWCLGQFLREFKNNDKEQKNIDLLIDFWTKNRNPVFGKAVADALSNQGADRSAAKLLELIREEKGNKNYLSSILYRLEFGRIGISEEGVEYLEKMYDLGEYNNPDYHVSRLTASGEVGIFDESLELIKYFQLGDLDSDDKNVKAKVLDFVYETLFIEKENESEEERQKRLKYLQEFKKNYYDLSQDELFEETGVKLNNLDFREQGWFLKYLNEADEDRKERLKSLIQNFGEEGMKTFLSLELGEENGETILHLAEKLDRPVAEAVFVKFNELTALIKQSQQEIGEKYFNKNIKINPNIETIKRAQKILVDFDSQARLLDYANLPKEQKKEINAKIFDKLNHINNEASFFGSVFRSAFEQGGSIDFEDMKNINFENIFAPELLAQKPEYVEQMKIVEDKNYPTCQIGQDVKTNPNCYTDEFRQAQLDGFEAMMSNPRVKVYNLSKNENENENENGNEVPVSFLAIENYDLEENDRRLIKKFTTFNVNPDYRGSKFGEAMMSRCLDAEARDSVILANCSPKALIAQKYIESGFVATKVFEYKGEDGFDIIRDDDKNSNYKSKLMSMEDLLKYQGDEIEMQKTDKGELPDFSKLENNYVLTRYFTRDDKIYTVFEKIK